MSCCVCDDRARFTSGHGGPLVCGARCQALLACGPTPLDMGRDVFALMTARLPQKDLFSLRGTTKEIAEVVNTYPEIWTSRRFTAASTATPEDVIGGLASIGRHVRMLDLYHMRYRFHPTPAQLSTILDAEHAPQVTTLRLPPYTEDNHLSILERQVPGLTMLDLSYHYLGHAGAAAIGKLRNLVHLDIEHAMPIQPLDLSLLIKSPRLTSLHINSCSWIDDEGLSVLATAPRLTILSCDGNRSLSDVGIAAAVALMPTLVHLYLWSCPNVVAESLTALARAPNLLSLALAGCRRVDNDALSKLSTAPLLEYLDLADCPLVSEAGLREIAKLPRLRHLDIAYCHAAGDAGVTALTGARHLLSLNIYYVPASNETKTALLAANPKLRIIDSDETEATVRKAYPWVSAATMHPTKAIWKP